jgi:alkylation response protein AidB-like acyl-CoA dehydrogenase
VDFSLTAEDQAFGDELRSWLDKNLEQFLTETEDEEQRAAGAVQVRRKAWQRRMNEGGWAAVHWPTEWGGRETTPVQRLLYSEILAEYRTPGIYNTNGIWQIGPMLIQWGTEEQKKRWLPSILEADEHWCQGFSEPDAGNDLANLRTMAILDAGGDHYVVNGQKIWISTAHLAKWGLFLFRTDPTAIERGAKHEGITAFVVDLESEGVEVRPIRDMSGDEMFNEVYFRDVSVPVDYRLGGEGEGWLVAMGTLGHERVGIAGQIVNLSADLRAMVEAARALNPEALEDPVMEDRLARAWTEIELTRLLVYRALSKVMRGEKNWPEVPFSKLQYSVLAQTLAELAVDLLGPAGLLTRGGPDAVDRGKWARLYSFNRFTTIGGGSTEVQKNIIADRAIKLPGQARS